MKTTSTNGAPGEFSMVIPMTAKDGAPAQNFTLSFAGSMQQNVGSDSVSKVAQDGYAAGEYTNFQINNDGTVVGIYSNQQTGAGPDRHGQLLQPGRAGVAGR